jgi:type III pantothenate kinase
VIVCSFGTATTIDVAGKDRVFRGGIIAPGLKTSANALKSNTSQLPESSITEPSELIGTSTYASILSGIVFGHLAMFEGLITRLRKELDERPTVVATGGFASLIDRMSDIIDIVDNDLTLHGLRILNSRADQT